MNNCLYLVWQHYKGFIESVLTSVLTLILCEVCVFWFVAKSFLSVLELFLTNQGLCRIINWLFAVRCPLLIVRFSTWIRFPNISQTENENCCDCSRKQNSWKRFLIKVLTNLVKRSTILFQSNAERMMWNRFREEKPKRKNLVLRELNNEHV